MKIGGRWEGVLLVFRFGCDYIFGIRDRFCIFRSSGMWSEGILVKLEYRKVVFLDKEGIRRKKFIY